jgi:hypothetical protein
MQEFVQSCAFLKWCPHPDCVNAIYDPFYIEKYSTKLNKIDRETISKTVDCGAGHYYCW